jgi:hypothetical protein
MRKLASIQKIKSINPIDNADFIEQIGVLGWCLVAKKGEFKEGDLCIFFEIDSKLKPIETYSFLEKNKYRVKTQMFRGMISQGLALPISILEKDGVLEDGWTYDSENHKLTSILTDISIEEGVDLTDIIGVEKYDLEGGESLQSERFKLNPKKSKLVNKLNYLKWKIKTWLKIFNKGSDSREFPSHLVPKTDESRIQSYSDNVIESLKGSSFTKSVKMDGSSMTVVNNGKEFIVCSRNLSLKDSSNNKFWQMVHKYDLKNKMRKMKMNIALQMELIGEGVQGNRYNIKGNDIRLFKVCDINTRKYLTPKQMVEIAKKLDIPHVHIADENFIFNHSVEDLVKISTVKAFENPSVEEEGFVYHLNSEDKNFSFKVINPKYLLEKDKKEC